MSQLNVTKTLHETNNVLWVCNNIYVTYDVHNMFLVVTFHISYITYHVTNLISSNGDVTFHVAI